MADSPSGSRPLLRVGGIALLGVGVIAATIGLFTSATQGNGTGTAVPSASSQALPPSGGPSATEPVPTAPPSAVAPDTALPAPTAPAVPNASPEAPPAAQPPDAQPPAAQPPAAQPPVAAPVPGGGGAAQAGAGAGGEAVRAPLRVYNNSTVQGLAAKAKSDFESRGWTVTDISGYPNATIPHSTAYFRPGTTEEAAAQELGREFGLRVEPRFPGIEQSSAGVIVILTEDYAATGKS